MSNLPPPPPVSAKVMLATAALLGALAVFTLVLGYEELVPASVRSKISRIFFTPPVDPAEQADYRESQRQKESSIAESVDDPKYRRQLEHLTSNTASEKEYLDQRHWSIWHQIFPLFALSALALWLLGRRKQRRTVRAGKPECAGRDAQRKE